jgi:hypothetical protein
MAYTTYCGYRPYATQSLLTAPPGQSSEVHGKFHHPFTAEVPDATALGQTEAGRRNAQSLTAVADANTLRMSQRALTPASVTSSAANLVSRSMYGAEYPNYFTEGPQLRDASEEELRMAFSLVDTGNSGVATVASARKLLAASLHHEPSRRQLDVLEATLAKNSVRV